MEYPVVRYKRRYSRALWVWGFLIFAAVTAVVVGLAVHFTRLHNSNNRNVQRPEFPTRTLTTSQSRSTAQEATLSATKSSSSTPDTSAVPSGDLDDIDIDLLDRHNELRALHGSGKLTWNWTLAEFAADYANRTLDCNNLKLVHSGGPYGENLAAGYSGGFAPVQVWYDEIKLYDYKKPGFSEETGHFTQLIWNSTTELGCAIVNCNNEWGQYTICEYQKAGNIVGSTDKLTQELFNDNVLPLLKSSSLETAQSTS